MLCLKEETSLKYFHNFEPNVKSPVDPQPKEMEQGD